MATSASAKQLYPFSTEDGKAIPLDIALPLGLRIVGASQQLVVTAGDPELGYYYCKTGCYIVPDAAAVPPWNPALVYEDSFFLPPEHLMTIKLGEGTYKIINVGASSPLVITYIQKYSGLALKRQVAQG